MIKVIGINHKTAPIEVRECYYLNDLQQDLLLSELKNNPLVVEACVLSTCNRTEIYTHLIEDKWSLNDCLALISAIKQYKIKEGDDIHFYTHYNELAIHHLFRVASGLDSLVLGEKQILGQVKSAVEKARKWGIFAKKFNILFDLAIRVGKKARSATHIGFGGSSISWAAMTLAEKAMGSLENKTVLVVGAGKMSKLTVGHVSNKGFKKLYLMNRTKEKALPLARQFGGEAVGFDDIKEVLAETDLTICASGAPHYIIDREIVEKVTIKNPLKVMTFIDISMPRNIDPAIAGIPNIHAYHIDDLKAVVEESMLKRRQAVQEVGQIIEETIVRYFKKINKQSNMESADWAGIGV